MAESRHNLVSYRGQGQRSDAGEPPVSEESLYLVVLSR